MKVKPGDIVMLWDKPKARPPMSRIRFGFPVLIREVDGRKALIAFYKWHFDDTIIECWRPVNLMSALRATDMALAQRSKIFLLAETHSEKWQPDVLPFLDEALP